MPRLRLAVLWGTLPIYLAIMYSYNLDSDYSWVSRSGAITVIAGIWLVFKSFDKWNTSELVGPYIDERNIWKDPNVEEKDEAANVLRHDRKSAHIVLLSEKILLIFGTFIWGFGDLLTHIPNQKYIYWTTLALFVFQFVVYPIVQSVIVKK